MVRTLVHDAEGERPSCMASIRSLMQANRGKAWFIHELQQQSGAAFTLAEISAVLAKLRKADKVTVAITHRSPRINVARRKVQRYLWTGAEE